MTDEKLLHKAGRGDEAAFLALYERHRDTVFRFAYRMLGSAALAEEVTHDCFLSLVRRPDAFDPSRAALRTYLYAAVRNLSIKHLRRRGGEFPFEDLEDEPEVEGREGPLERLLDAELSEEVRKAVTALPEQPTAPAAAESDKSLTRKAEDAARRMKNRNAQAEYGAPSASGAQTPRRTRRTRVVIGSADGVEQLFPRQQK